MRLLCPRCSTPIPEAEANLTTGLCRCPPCGEFFKIDALLTEPSVVATRTAKPAYSTIELFLERDTLSFLLPPQGWKGATWFFLLFSAFWNAITWTFVGLGLAELQWFILLFMVPFIAVGLGTAGAVLFFLKGEFTFVLDRAEARGIWSVFRWHYTRRLPVAEITDVIEEVVYTKNDQPVYGIGLKAGTRTLKFGSTLSEDERRWLIGEIRHFLAAAR